MGYQYCFGMGYNTTCMINSMCEDGYCRENYLLDIPGIYPGKCGK